MGPIEASRRSRHRKISSGHSDLHFTSATLQRRLRAAPFVFIQIVPAARDHRNILVSDPLIPDSTSGIRVYSIYAGARADACKSRSIVLHGRKGRLATDTRGNGYKWARGESSRESVMPTSYEISVVRWDETRYGDGTESLGLRLLVSAHVSLPSPGPFRLFPISWLTLIVAHPLPRVLH